MAARDYGRADPPVTVFDVFLRDAEAVVAEHRFHVETNDVINVVVARVARLWFERFPYYAMQVARVPYNAVPVDHSCIIGVLPMRSVKLYLVVPEHEVLAASEAAVKH